MSDFSVVAYCTRHKVRFCPDDGGCPQCDDSRCPTCGKLPDSAGEYSCSCEEMAQSAEYEQAALAEVFNRGWNRGNYAGTYENVGIGVGASGISVAEAMKLDANHSPADLRAACKCLGEGQLAQAWVFGFTLGVYSTFEDYEVGREDWSRFMAALEFALEHELDTHREPKAGG